MEKYQFNYYCSESREALAGSSAEYRENNNWMPKVADYSDNQDIVDTLYFGKLHRGYMQNEERYYSPGSPDFGKFLLKDILFHFFKNGERGKTYIFAGELENDIFYIIKGTVALNMFVNPSVLEIDDIKKHFKPLIDCGIISLEKYVE